MSIHLSEVSAGDQDFLFSHFKEICIEKLNAFSWPEESVSKIVEIQFHAYCQHYNSVEGKKDYVIFFKKEKCGRLILIEEQKSFYLSDISIDSNFRRCGVGFAVLKILAGFAGERNKKFLKLRVSRGNTAAINLYKKAGFIITKDLEIDFEMLLSL